MRGANTTRPPPLCPTQIARAIESTATEPGESDMDVSEDGEADGLTEEQLNDGRTDGETIAGGEAPEDGGMVGGVTNDHRETDPTAGM